MRREFWKVGIVTLLLTQLSACSPTIRYPRLASPGTAPLQRYNAEQFDPYPQNDVGPEIVGGRPLDYAVPVSEVNRARQSMPVGEWRQGSRY
jgi:hypothetical protein